MSSKFSCKNIQDLFSHPPPLGECGEGEVVGVHLTKAWKFTFLKPPSYCTIPVFLISFLKTRPAYIEVHHKSKSLPQFGPWGLTIWVTINSQILFYFSQIPNSTKILLPAAHFWKPDYIVNLDLEKVNLKIYLNLHDLYFFFGVNRNEK